MNNNESNSKLYIYNRHCIDRHIWVANAFIH